MNLFVFSIGGSGARVLHSLCMLLACGMECKVESITPVFIDTDNDNGNLKEVRTLIASYQKIFEKTSMLNGQVSKFKQGTFSSKYEIDKTPIFSTRINNPISITVDGTYLQNLSTVIDYSSKDINLDLKSKVETLYSKENREMPLKFGFIGNPNIGSVVLNYLLDAENSNFKQAVKQIAESDKIFIISSIFGGTGAAGYPLLVNKLNFSSDGDINRSRNIKGALSVLPYFTLSKNKKKNVESDDLNKKTKDGQDIYRVDYSLFDAKAFAAQLYYDNYINKGLIDAVYYVGNKEKKSEYIYCLGGEGQKNEANAVELMGALTIIDFANAIKKADKTNYCDCVFSNDKSILTPSDIYNDSLKLSLMRMWMFKRFYENYLKDYLNSSSIPFLIDIGFTKGNGSYSDGTSSTILDFLKLFGEWCADLESGVHNRKFRFVDTGANVSDDEIHHKFENTNIKSKKSDFLNYMNRIYKNQDNISTNDIHAKMIRFSTQVINYIISDKIQ